MKLKKNGTGLKGQAVTPKNWDKLLGTVNPDGSFFLEAYEKGKNHKGNYTGRFTSDRTIEGSWSSVGGYENIEFYVSQN
jgi:hypothetical protein